jgi:hypothetical protein
MSLEIAPPGWAPWDAFGAGEGGDNIMDPVFNGMGRSEMYRACLFPDLFPHEKPMLLHQWPLEDLVMYCGGEYAK